jgi:hypothetical protein
MINILIFNKVIHTILVIAQLVERETVEHCADISRSLVQFRLARIFFQILTCIDFYSC